ncbi:MAG TPA: polyketide synthase, partial [Vicinamibacterales bacterium]|nr:polyketide synthase [Vicinamibacterales bacterium]
MDFAPIAIVGQGCALPLALSPQELWRLVLDGKDALTPPPAGYWHHATLAGLTYPEAPPLQSLFSNRGGFVHGFDDRFDAGGYRLNAESILALDPLFRWLLYAGREALRDAGHDTRTSSPRAGVIVGNLSYPTRALVELAERVWWKRDPREAPPVDARNRFSSGLPAHILAKALGLGAGAFALDAACASSLYAIKLACDWLHDGRADLMLAGGVNGADGFIIHGGFSVLRAISPTGRSRPFHRQADGLVPAEGAALVALKRLEDAEIAGDRILGIVRSVGLSNDGRGHGFLVPSATAQSRAMHQAYAMAGLRPADVSLVECHATGTQVGDATEIRSMAQVFGGVGELAIGSLKSNLGHLITAAGAAGLLKLLAAMDAGLRPPTLHADAPIEVLAGSPFRLLDRAEPWTDHAPRRAGLSAFGFGGNNAHLVLEQWTGPSRRRAAAPAPP